MSDTAIEWADRVWNPTTGCDRVSPGCDHCYALTMAKRLKGMGHRKYQRDGNERTSGPGFAATHHSEVVGDPFKWKRPQRIFVNSMSDLFHDDIPDQFIAAVWATMKRNPRHTFIVLTKRHGRMRSLLSSEEFRESVFTRCGVGPDSKVAYPQYCEWPVPNVHLVVSVENQFWAEARIRALLDTPAAVRGISVEPMLSGITLYQHWLHPVMRAGADPAVGRRIGEANGVGFIDWVICGGESGHGARAMNPRWARSLRDQCIAANVPFFFKQHGNWEPAPWKLQRLPDEFTLDYKRRSEELCATHAFTGGLYQDDEGNWVENFMKLGHAPWSAERDSEAPPCTEGMRRVAKKAAVAELDGQVWNQFPEEVMV